MFGNSILRLYLYIMKVGTKEFHELVKQFESDYRTIGKNSSDFRKESNAPKGYFYCNADVNLAFNFYMAGFESAKCLARMDALDLNS